MGKNTPEKSEESNKKSGVLGDIRAVISQLKSAKSLLKHDPDLDEIVDYGSPFKLKYVGRKEDIKRILDAAETKNYVEKNENEEYKITKKGKRASSVAYVEED